MTSLARVRRIRACEGEAAAQLVLEYTIAEAVKEEREACAEKARTAEILLRILAGVKDNNIDIFSLREEARNYFRRSNVPGNRLAADALNGAAGEIERLQTALDDALDDRRTQYLSPEDRAKHQGALNAAMRNALDNVALAKPGDKAAEEDEFVEMYVGLESLSKALEGSGRIDEHDHPDAYKTILMAMAFVKKHEPNVVIQGPPIGGPAGMEGSTT